MTFYTDPFISYDLGCFNLGQKFRFLPSGANTPDLDVSHEEEADQKGLAKNIENLATQSSKNPESVT